jgi:Predicted integral membrane protein
MVPDARNISGMLIGTYTGGTPNMFAIGNGLGSSNERILLLQASDMIGGGTYFFLLLSVMPKLLKKVLPEYIPVGNSYSMEETQRYAEEFSGKKQNVKPFKAFMNRVGLVLLSTLCVAFAIGICLLIPSKYGNTGFGKLGEHTAVIMLIVTSCGIALSFVKKIRNATGSYSSGQYFLLMFSVVMGLCFDLSAVGGALVLLVMLLIIQFGTVLLHLVMAKIWKIDYHTMMITSTAGVFGPAFIIPVSKALHNDEIILPGILCGILGYAIGNYLGIGVGDLLGLLS